MKKSYVDKLQVLRLSPSSMKTYEGCHRKWFYTYLERPDIKPKDQAHLILGNFVHEVLEHFHVALMGDANLDRNLLMKECCRTAESLSKFKGKITKEIRASATKMLKEYLVMLEVKGLPNVLSAEQKFVIKISDGLSVTGIIDRIDQLETDDPDAVEGKFHVVDYKTGKSRHLDEFQLLVYGLHVLDAHPETQSFKGSYLALKEDMKWISYSFSRTDLERVRSEIIDIANQIKEDRTWDPKPQFLCGYCDYEDYCDSSPKNTRGVKKVEDVAGGEIEWA